MHMNNGITPLYLACQLGFLEIAQHLGDHNAAAKIKAYDGMSCLHAAAQQGHLPLVKWLVGILYNYDIYNSCLSKMFLIFITHFV